MKIGFTFQPGALWVGAHYSKYNKRLCITLLPMLTVYFVFAGGNSPKVERTIEHVLAELEDLFYKEDLPAPIKLVVPRGAWPYLYQLFPSSLATIEQGYRRIYIGDIIIIEQEEREAVYGW